VADQVAQERVDAALEDAARQQVRGDGKAAQVQQSVTALLGIAAAGMAIARPGPVGTVLGALALACLTASFLVVYVGATRPRLRDRSGRSHGFPLWAREGLTPGNAPRSPDCDLPRVKLTARRTVEIFEAVTAGGDLMAAGLVLLALAAVATVAGL
jgi:hypothetical protein